MNWLIISEEDQLDTPYKQSFDPSVAFVLVFKDSPRCGISNMARDRLERKWVDTPRVPAFYVNVLLSRPASNKIAKQYQVEHQSPQVLLIKEGNCIYNASHSDISSESIQAFL